MGSGQLEGGGLRDWGEMISVNGQDGERLNFLNFLPPLFESFDRRSCSDGSRELIPIFHNHHRKD